MFSLNLKSNSRAFDFGVSRHLSNQANTAGETDDGDCWDSDGLGYHTPGDDEGGDMEMLEAACEDCGPLRDRPASAWAVQPSRPRRACTWPLGGYATWRTLFWARR